MAAIWLPNDPNGKRRVEVQRTAECQCQNASDATAMSALADLEKVYPTFVENSKPIKP
jgi:hypothetical protein